MTGLTDEQKSILDFERQWWKHAGAKDRAIREKFACSSTRYYQLLNAAIDHPAADAYDALGVRRLRRLRAARAQRRSALRLTYDTT